MKSDEQKRREEAMARLAARISQYNGKINRGVVRIDKTILTDWLNSSNIKN